MGIHERGITDALIIALDPGETTGITKMRGIHHILSYEKRLDHQAIYKELRQATPLDVIVCENFFISNIHASTYTAQIIGVITLFAQEHNIPLIMQTPEQRKYWTNYKLKLLNMYKVGTKGHDNDSLRHLLVYVSKHTNYFNRKFLEAKAKQRRGL